MKLANPPSDPCALGRDEPVTSPLTFRAIVIGMLIELGIVGILLGVASILIVIMWLISLAARWLAAVR